MSRNPAVFLFSVKLVLISFNLSNLKKSWLFGEIESHLLNCILGGCVFLLSVCAPKKCWGEDTLMHVSLFIWGIALWSCLLEASARSLQLSFLFDHFVSHERFSVKIFSGKSLQLYLTFMAVFILSLAYFSIAKKKYVFVCNKNQSKQMIRVMASKGKDWEFRLIIVCLTNAVPMSGFHGEYLIPGGPYIMYASWCQCCSLLLIIKSQYDIQ